MADLAAELRRQRTVGIDTSIFIYHIEAGSTFSDAAGVAMSQLARGQFLGVTSVLTLMEITVRPLQLQRPDVSEEYELLLANYPNLTISDIDRPAVRRAAELRASYRLRPADALQIGVCIEQGAAAFLTNDSQLQRLTELKVLILGDFVAD